MSDDAAAKITRRTVAAAVACAVVAAGAGVAVWTQRPRLEAIEVSQQTTYLITPTRADGWVDYPAAVDWMRRASLDAGGANAALSLVRALGPDALPVGVDREALLERLGIAPAGDESLVFRTLDRFTGPDAPGRPEPPPATMSWLRARCRDAGKKQASLARVVAWLARSEPALANLRVASQAASLYVPVARGAPTGAFDRVDVGLLGGAADALRCDAAVKLLLGDAAGSWADVDASWRLGQLLARAATTGEYGVAGIFWQAALTGTVDLTASAATRPDLLSAMQAGLGAKLGFPPASETMMFQRLSVLEAAGTPLVAPPRPGAQASGPMARLGARAILEAINERFDAVDVALQSPDPKQRIARVDQVAATSAPQVGPVARNMLAIEIDAVSRHRLASLAVALARRLRDGGKLPASLGELADAPRDPGSGASFSYAVAAPGFRLHGVGGDGRDDGGDPARDVVAEVTETPRLAPP